MNGPFLLKILFYFKAQIFFELNLTSMKSFIFISPLQFILLSSVIILSSCSGGNKKNGDENQDSQESSAYTSKSGKVTISYNDFWKFISPYDYMEVQAAGNKDHFLFVWVEPSSGDILAGLNSIIERKSGNPDYRIVHAAEMTEIDQMPAAYAQISYYDENKKENIIESTWMVFNGREMFAMNSTCSSESINEEEINNIPRLVKINERDQDISLEARKDEINPRPGVYPEKAVKSLESRFSDQVVLTPEKIENMTKAFDDIMTAVKSGEAESDRSSDETINNYSVAIHKYGFKDWYDLKNTVAVSSTCIILVPTLSEMEKNEGNDAAYGLASGMASEFITQGEISMEDTKFVYENWDLVNEKIRALSK
jgi:hypothetical protein